MVHTLVQALAGQIPADEVTASLRRIWDQVDVGAQWYSTHELARVESMLDHFGTWLERSRGDLEEIGVEVDVDVVLPPDPDDPADAVGVRIRGRIDRLERDAQGRPVIVDVKTGKTPVSKGRRRRTPTARDLPARGYTSAVSTVFRGRNPVADGWSMSRRRTGRPVPPSACNRRSPPTTSPSGPSWCGTRRGAAPARDSSPPSTPAACAARSPRRARRRRPARR